MSQLKIPQLKDKNSMFGIGRFAGIVGLCLIISLSGHLKAQNYLIHAGKLLDVERLEVLKNYSISVVDNRIVSVQQGFQKPEAGSLLIDLSDKTVLPGLMDMHVHLSKEFSNQTYGEKFFIEEAEAAIRSTVFAKKTLEAGFTSVRDLGDFYPGLTVSLRNSISKGYIVGPRIFAAGKSIATTGGHGDPTNGLKHQLMGDPGPLQGVINGPQDAFKAVRQRYKEGSDVIKLTVTGGVLSLARNGANPQFTEEELAAVVAAARDYDFVVAVHAHGAEGMKRAIRAGVDSVEHGSYMDKQAIILMKKHGTYYVPTISAGKWVAEKAAIEGYYPEIVRPKAALIGPQISKTFATAYKKGVKIAFGTDAGVFPHGMNAKEFVYMVEAGMPEFEAIQSATINAAKLLKVEQQLGSIAKGKFADIIALDGDPLKDISLLQSISFVMKDGQVVKQENQ